MLTFFISGKALNGCVEDLREFKDTMSDDDKKA